MDAESLIFDMDGTLWDCAGTAAQSWTEILKTQPDIQAVITADDMYSVMGIPMDAIGRRLFSSVSPKRQKELLDLCGTYENEYIRRHGAKLYDGVGATLSELSRSHRLFIVSNCQCGYIEAFLAYYGFEKYFTDHLCWGDTGVPKSESIRLIMNKNNIKNAVYVGDIQGDCDSARQAGIGFIHAAYGFGTVREKDAEIRKFPDLLSLFTA